MAPEIALRECDSLRPGSLVLDPMLGSGTVARVASQRGHRAVGFDMDPLAVLMSRVWTTPICVKKLREAASDMIAGAEETNPQELPLPWIDQDVETGDFVEYWFGAEQRADLRRLSYKLHDLEGPVSDALRIALSRIIITKDRGASLARDVSHSRPHKVREESSFPVMREFARSAERLARQLELYPPPGGADVKLGDARDLRGVPADCVDAIITSPPYLNAIDYLRGHKLSLVWLGYSLSYLRDIRRRSVGAERAADSGSDVEWARHVLRAAGLPGSLPGKEQRILERYALDLLPMLAEMHRVLKPGSKAVLVIGNSFLRGVYINNAEVLLAVARQVGFAATGRWDRVLPPNRRYLPPPGDKSGTELEKRMRTETVLTCLRQ